jgi:hypothetical protein
VEEKLRKRVADCKIFLKNTRSFPPRAAALSAYAEAVEELDKFLASENKTKTQKG